MKPLPERDTSLYIDISVHTTHHIPAHIGLTHPHSPSRALHIKLRDSFASLKDAERHQYQPRRHTCSLSLPYPPTPRSPVSEQASSGISRSRTLRRVTQTQATASASLVRSLFRSFLSLRYLCNQPACLLNSSIQSCRVFWHCVAGVLSRTRSHVSTFHEIRPGEGEDWWIRIRQLDC